MNSKRGQRRTQFPLYSVPRKVQMRSSVEVRRLLIRVVILQSAQWSPWEREKASSGARLGGRSLSLAYSKPQPQPFSGHGRAGVGCLGTFLTGTYRTRKKPCAPPHKVQTLHLSNSVPCDCSHLFVSITQDCWHICFTSGSITTVTASEAAVYDSAASLHARPAPIVCRQA